MCAGCGGHICPDCIDQVRDEYGLNKDHHCDDCYAEEAPAHCPACDPDVVTKKDVGEYLLKHDPAKYGVFVAEILEKRKGDQ